MRAQLQSMGLLEVIDGLVPENPRGKWKRKNEKAVSDIISYLANSQISAIQGDNPVAKYIFIKLEETYNRKSQATQLVIRSKLRKFKLENHTPLQTF